MDAHPDSFTAAVLKGDTPAQAIQEKVCNQVPMGQLKKWANQNLTSQDLVVLEASGNSFQIVRDLKSIKIRALVLESCQMGKLKDAHANNDKISAVRIGKAYLSGTAKVVWVPDPLTQERRDWFLTHQKQIKRTTQLQNRLLSYLSDKGVRFKKGSSLSTIKKSLAKIRKARKLTQPQWEVIDSLTRDLEHAKKQRAAWRSNIAKAVLEDPKLLQIVRLCGVRDLIAFAVGALVGDINRFESPASLVKYIGLNPSFEESGQSRWRGGVGKHGRKDLRSLLIQGAQSIMRSKNNHVAKWGRKLLSRKSARNLAVAAVARKLAVAIWYLMMGRWTKLEEIDPALKIKIGKIVGAVGKDTLAKMKKAPLKYREEICALLMDGVTVHMLKPT